MERVDLGTCCADCFAALNYTLKDMNPKHRQRATAAMDKLSALADAEGVQSLHTGDYAGFVQAPCLQCGSKDSGDRWQLIGLKENRYGG